MEIFFTNAIERFLEHCRIARTLSHHTLKAYEADLAHAQAHLCSCLPVVSIGREELRRYAGLIGLPHSIEGRLPFLSGHPTCVGRS